MNVLEIITEIVFIVCSLSLSFYALRRWLKEKRNHEDIFSWGAAFALVMFTFIAYFVDNFFHLYGLNYTVHMADTVSFVFQFYAVALNIIPCDETHKCDFCYRKRMRLTKWLVILPVIFSMPIFAMNNIRFYHNPPGIFGMQVLGVLSLDIIVELVHLAMCVAIFRLLPNKQWFMLLKRAYAIMAASELIQLTCVFTSFKYASLCEAQLGLSVVAIVIMFFSVYKIIKEKN